MIWAPDKTGTEESAVVTHLTAAIDGVCGSVLSANASTVQELAKAVELYLSQNGNDFCVDSQHLMLLASKALDSIGEGKAARRMLLFGTGLIKPSEWEITGGDTMWVLDLRQLTLREDAPIELVFFSSLSMILESVSDVWDESQGKGVLGLRHVCSAVCDLTGGGSLKKKKAMTAEIKGICARKLGQLKESRKWNEIPAVIDLDV